MISDAAISEIIDNTMEDRDMMDTTGCAMKPS